MKKILTVVASMLLVVCMMFMLGSCGGVSVDQVKDDPAAIVSEAFDLSAAEFFMVDAGAAKIINESLNSGAVTFSLEGNDALASMFGPAFSEADLKAIMYSDFEKEKYVLEIDSEFANEDIEGILFLDKEKFVLQSESFLGTDTAYSVTIDKFLEKYEGSVFETLIDPAGYGDGQLIEDFQSIKDAYAKLFEDYNRVVNEISLAVYKALDYEVSADKVDGTPVVVVTMSINNDNMDDVFRAMAEEMGLSGDLKDEYDEEIEDLLATLNENINFECEVKIAIDQATRKLSKATLDFVMTSTDEEFEGESVSVKADFAINETKLMLDVKIDGKVEDEFEYDLKLVGEKKVDKDAVKYDFALDIDGEYKDIYGYDDETIEGTVFTAAFEYDKKSGDFELEIESGEDFANMNVSLEGNLGVKDRSVTLLIEEIGSNPVALEIGMKVKFEKGVAIPAAPEAKELVELNERELEELIGNIKKNSIFAKMN